MGPEEDFPCNLLVELITDYLEDKLPPRERARFEEHLARCRGCQTYMEQMRQTIRLSGRLTEDGIPAPAKQRLLAAFRDWKRGES
jgi:anti-sigma factor RsiW